MGRLKNFKIRKMKWNSRNEGGNFNITSYRYTKPREKVVSVKYDDEIHICMGVASVKMPCEKIEGRRTELIDYTGKVITSEEESNKKFKMRLIAWEKIVERSGLLTLTHQDIIAIEYLKMIP